MQKRLRGVRDPGVSDTADHPVVSVDRQSEHVPTVDIGFRNGKQIGVQSGLSPKRVLCGKNQKEHVVAIGVIIGDDLHG